MLNERIENKRFEKLLKALKWGAAITLLLTILRIALFPEVLSDGGKTSDFILTLIPIGLYFQYRQTAKNWGGQFIAWTENEISFKSRKYKHTTIKLSDINSINIRLHLIEIDTSEMKYKINIEDYSNYKDRIRLKNNFEKVNEKLNHSTTFQSS